MPLLLLYTVCPVVQDDDITKDAPAAVVTGPVEV